MMLEGGSYLKTSTSPKSQVSLFPVSVLSGIRGARGNMPWVLHTSESVSNRSDYPAILGVFLSLTATMVLAVATRTYAKAKIVKRVGWDDATIIFTAVGCPRYGSCHAFCS